MFAVINMLHNFQQWENQANQIISNFKDLQTLDQF